MPLDWTALGQVIRDTQARFEVPGLSILVSNDLHGKPERLDVGSDAAGTALDAASLFPAASLTKLATALAVLRLVDSGGIALDDPLSTHLPAVEAAGPLLTIRSLLCHTSGMPFDFPNQAELYGRAHSWRELADQCIAVEAENPPWTRVTYSNVGYGLLALVVERVTNQEFARALHSLVLAPLGIEGYLGDEPPRAPVQLADIRSRHAGTESEPFNSAYWRALGLPWGGLVTTAAGAFKLLRAFVGLPGDFLTSELRHVAVSDQTEGLPGGYGERFDFPRCPWGLGPDLHGAKVPHWAPRRSSPATYGHAGASGCVVWHDPEAQVSWGIFGTRTADNAWLVRGASSIGQAILDASSGGRNGKD